MRIIIYIMLIVLTTTFIGCSSENDIKLDHTEKVEGVKRESNDIENKAGELEAEIDIITNQYNFNDDNISVTYPSILGLSKVEEENKINELLKTEALSYIYLLDDIDEELFYNLDFQVLYKGDRLLSIGYYGSTYIKGASYPTDVFFTTNIDIVNSKKLTLEDFVVIDEIFVKSYLETISKETEEELENYGYQYIRESYTKDELINGFKQADFSYGKSRYIFSYFTGESIGISWEVPHAIGDHVEVEIPIEKLADNLCDIISDKLKD